MNVSGESRSINEYSTWNLSWQDEMCVRIKYMQSSFLLHHDIQRAYSRWLIGPFEKRRTEKCGKLKMEKREKAAHELIRSAYHVRQIHIQHFAYETDSELRIDRAPSKPDTCSWALRLFVMLSFGQLLEWLAVASNESDYLSQIIDMVDIICTAPVSHSLAPRRFTIEMIFFQYP